MVDVFDGVIHMFGVIAFVSDEDAFLKRDNLICLFKNSFNHSRIHDVSSCSEFIERKTRNAVNKDMILVQLHER